MFKVGDKVTPKEGCLSRFRPGDVLVVDKEGAKDDFRVTHNREISWHDASQWELAPISEVGRKFDAGKPPMDLLPYGALIEVAKVLGFGAKKYDAGNWANGLEVSRLIAAAERHIGEFKEGQDADIESGLMTLAHAVCPLLFAIWMLKNRPDMDNRWIKGVSGRNNNQGEE